jgi:hypothetical protein
MSRFPNLGSVDAVGVFSLNRWGPRARCHPSDLTDEQRALVEPLIPIHPGGRPRKTATRDVLNAIIYLLRLGCQWSLMSLLVRASGEKRTASGAMPGWEVLKKCAEQLDGECLKPESEVESS